jgi:hypothetical protein
VPFNTALISLILRSGFLKLHNYTNSALCLSWVGRTAVCGAGGRRPQQRRRPQPVPRHLRVACREAAASIVGDHHRGRGGSRGCRAMSHRDATADLPEDGGGAHGIVAGGGGGQQVHGGGGGGDGHGRWPRRWKLLLLDRAVVQ